MMPQDQDPDTPLPASALPSFPDEAEPDVGPTRQVIDEDAQLVERVQRGDQRAFEMLVVKYQRRIERLIARMVRDVDLVQDIAQESFIRAYRALPNFRGESAFYTWLYRIAVNTAKKALMDLKRDPLVLEKAHEGEDGEPWQPDAGAWQHWPAPASAAPQGDELAFWRRAGEKLLACLDELPLAQRSAFLLHHDDGLALSEVAHALEVGFETAKTRLRYAMAKLRACMGAYLAPESPR